MTRIAYSREKLLRLRAAPASQEKPENLPKIPGVTIFFNQRKRCKPIEKPNLFNRDLDPDNSSVPCMA